MRPRPTALFTGLAAAATALALALTSAHAAPPDSTTISFVGHFRGPTNFVDNPPKTHGFNPGPGDILTAKSAIFDQSDARHLGRTSELCIATVARPFTMQCDISLLLGHGTLQISGAINPTKHPWSAPIVGGTGAYANARGTVKDSQLSSHRERLTVTLER